MDIKMVEKSVVYQTEIVLNGFRIENNPTYVFLSTVMESSRYQYTLDLKLISGLLGAPDPFTFNWASLRFSHTQAIRTKLQELVSDRTGKLLAPVTINRILTVLRGVLKTTWKLGQMDTEDYYRAVNIDSVKGETLLAGRELAKGEIMALMQDCENDLTNAGARDSAIIALAYSCGLRRAEIVTLDLDDYNCETGRLVIHGKGKKQRTAYLVNGAKQAVDDWLVIRGSEPGGLFLAIRKDDKIRPNLKISSQVIYNILHKRGRSANVANFSPHDMRRTFVSDLLEAGADIATIAKMAGHASVVTTARYDRRPEESKIRAAELLHVPYRGRNNE